ncbi:alkaline phosphatase D family protein [Rapidithrix thailandica]|uniref:Alkaline phosphatase D family protein n=1 Tax=Rapidithrix thailandica TaxID=413964 RepID=A0AAW9S9G4_9BACT
MQRILSLFIPFLLGILLMNCSPSKGQKENEVIQAEAPETMRIAFGSCSDEDERQPLWSVINQHHPDVWIWLGDNIYGDTEDMTVLKQKYTLQKSHTEYQYLINHAQVLGIWDDHDYGVNDGGKEYPMKKESKQAMLEFLDVPQENPVWQREGAYQSKVLGEGGQKVKVILLDSRYFRDALAPSSDPEQRYVINEEGDILGEAQWQWLEQELTGSDAAIHLIGNGIQIIPEEQGFEKWANFPKARKRLFDLLAKVKAQNVILLSGDRHMAEISKMEVPGLAQPVYEITSSGLTHTWSEKRDEPNRYRVGEMVVEKNFALLKIEWSDAGLSVQTEIRGENDSLYLSQKII